MKLNPVGFAHVGILLIVVVLVGVGGTYFLVDSQARFDNSSRRKKNPWTSECPGNRVKFGTPRRATATAEARERVFGPAGTNLAVMTFMDKQVTVNRKIVPCLRAVEWDLNNKYRTGYVLKEIHGYNDLSAQNPAHYFHAYGGAVDINPQQNPQCKGGCAHNMPNEWVRAFRAHGFYWGGKFPTTKDYMHFEWHGQK